MEEPCLLVSSQTYIQLPILVCFVLEIFLKLCFLYIGTLPASVQGFLCITCVSSVLRGHKVTLNPLELELTKVGSSHMGVRNQNWVLWKSFQWF